MKRRPPHAHRPPSAARQAIRATVGAAIVYAAIVAALVYGAPTP